MLNTWFIQGGQLIALEVGQTCNVVISILMLMVTVCSSIQSLGVSLRPAAGPGPRQRLGEVHHLHGVLVHRHRPRHRLRAAVLRPARDVGLGTLCKQTTVQWRRVQQYIIGVFALCLTLSAVRLLLHEVVAGPEGHEVGVVGGGGDGDGPGAAHVGVAQLVGQLLQLVSFEPEERNSCL